MGRFPREPAHVVCAGTGRIVSDYQPPPPPDEWQPQQQYQQPPPGQQAWPTMTYAPADRVVFAAQRRHESDYLFNFWTAFGWTLLTCGIYGYYVIYQLVRRMRDHNARRLEMLDAALAFSWEEAGRRGMQEELTPS